MPAGTSASFSASYDNTTKFVSVAVAALLLGMAAPIHNVAVGVLAALLLLGAYAWSPRGYTISSGSLLVRRLVGSVRIPLDGVREARRATADDFRGCLRLFGNGGLFGYYGLFRTSTLGKSTWYLTNRANSVVLVTAAKTVLVSPDEVDGFLNALHETAPPAAAPDCVGTRAVLDSAQVYGSGSMAGVLVGVAIGAIALVVVAFAMSYSPGPPRYTLTADSLTIHDRFYPVTLRASAVDVEHIRLVDCGDAEWRPTARTNGFANGHYSSGWFRVAGGRTVRMYRAGGTRLVLLPPKGEGAAVLMEAREPEQFLSELRRRWSGGS